MIVQMKLYLQSFPHPHPHPHAGPPGSLGFSACLFSLMGYFGHYVLAHSDTLLAALSPSLSLSLSFLVTVKFCNSSHDSSV